MTDQPTTATHPYVRPFGGTDIHFVDILATGNPAIVAVPGIGQAAAGWNIEAGHWSGGIAQPVGDPPAPAFHFRDVTEVDDHLELEVLPNPAGEDRLVVCIPLALIDKTTRSINMTPPAEEAQP